MPKKRIARKFTIEKAQEFSQRFPDSKQREAIKAVLAEFGIKNIVDYQAQVDARLLTKANELAQRQISANLETIEGLEEQNVTLHRVIKVRNSKLDQIQKIAEDWV